jgi:hypothetical protein
MTETAVGFLENQYNSNGKLTPVDFYQAKEMEKQQIIDAHGNKTKKSGSISNATYILTGEEYYETTFNKDE